MKYVVFDLETIKTIFTACFLDTTTGKKKAFKIYDNTDDLQPLLKFLKSLSEYDYVLVGFNSLNFDAQILEFIIGSAKQWTASRCPAESIALQIWEEAQRIISLDPADKWLHLLPEFKLTHKHIDLFRQKHYDGKQKMGTSLKWIQFTMRYPNVEDMPIRHDATVLPEQVDSVLSYNWNDVDSTAMFFKKNLFETELRAKLGEKFGLNLMNASEPRISKMVFAKFLMDDMGIAWSQLKEMRTYRKAIPLRQVIFKYIKFKTPELNDVLDKVRAVTLNPNNESFEYPFYYGGIKTVLALGGIHACCEPGVYSDSDEWVIHDVDVKSFYPNLAIVNGIKPKHLGDSYGRVYKMIYDERTLIPKKDPVNYVYKIVLNATYGLSKEVNSYLYDPFYTYSITINGQLSILMLVESLTLQVPGIKIYQENTDGVTVGYAPEYRDIVSDICTKWCEITKLELEHAYYKKMVIRDVNNYMAIKKEFDWDEYRAHVDSGKKIEDYGKIKHKGTFEIEMFDHKNPSHLIVKKATEAYFFGGVPYRPFIRAHQDIYDFLGAIKKKETFLLNIYKLIDNEQVAMPQQKVTRFYVSTTGSSPFIKDFHDGRQTAVLSDWKVSILNRVEETTASAYPDLDYRFYIKETERLIASVEGNIQQGSLF